MSLTKALALAKEKKLDLVEVAPQQDPPVCRIMDYGKYKYEQEKKRKSQKTSSVSELYFRPRIKEHDLMLKARQAERLLKEGNKVKVVVQLRGRESAHPEQAWKVLHQFALYLRDKAVVEKMPEMGEDSDVTLILAPLKK